MRAKVYKAVCLIVALVVAVFTAGYAFAWFIDRRNSPFEISGASAGAYFDSTSGDGTSADEAFVIANATHMRNLAVLQNTGRFVGTDGKPKTYYFEIKKTVDEIDMDGLWLPPIGNDKDPFIGVFNGNGKTIKNLKVTTDKTLLTVDNYPTQASPDYEFSNAVGLFGNTGANSEIRNFILENPVVLVGSEAKTLYGSSGKKVVGLAVGHVAGKCSSIGVRATDAAETSLQIVDANTKYSTFNSILGELSEGVESSVTGGGYGNGSGGSGNSFGANFDIDSMLERLYKIYKSKYGADYVKGNDLSPLPNSSDKLPQIDTSNNYPAPVSGAKLPFSINADKSTYEGPDAMESVSDQNVGYFLGNQNKFDSKKLTFGKPLNTAEGWNDWTDDDGKTPAQSGKVPMWFYTNTDTFSDPDTLTEDTKYNTNNTSYRSAGGFNALTQDEFDELPQGIKDLLPSSPGDKHFTPIRISQTYSNVTYNYGNDSNEQWSYHGQISWMGKTYGEGFKAANGKAVDENGNEITSGYLGNSNGQNHLFNAYTGGVALPNCAIWFKPSQAGKFRFVMYADKAGEGFTLLKYKRVNATKEEPFKVDPELVGGDLEATETIKVGGLPSDVFFYYEHEVPQDEIDAGNYEYVLMQYGNGGAYFIYLDIGASAAEDTSAVDPTKQVSAIDFIYDEVEISQSDVTGTDIKLGDFIVNTSGAAARYESSKTSVYFENITTIFKLVFLRLHNDTAGSHSGKTICLEKSDPVPNTSSEIKATFATYVCPSISGGSGTVSGGGGGGGTVTPTPDPDPTPAETVTQSADISGAKSANDVLMTVKDSDGNALATVTILCAGGDKTGATIDDGNGNTETGVSHIQTSSSPCLEFVLAEGYTYTVTIYAGSSGSGTRNITINGQAQETGAGSVCKAVTWSDLTAGTYNCTQSGNIRIARIVITATPV